MSRKLSKSHPLILISVLSLGVSVTVPDQAQALTFVDSWNFNSGKFNSSQGNGTLTTNFELANIIYFTGSSINSVGTDTAGDALALQGGGSNINNGRNITLEFNLTQYSDPILTFATRRTNTGFNNNLIEWSTDGNTFSTLGIINTNPYNPATSFALQTFDFSNVNSLDSVATAFLRITFDGASSASGNNRIDNIQLNATLNSTPVPFKFDSAYSLAIMGGVFSLLHWRKHYHRIISHK